MPAARYNITIEQGADFNLALSWSDVNGTPFDLTGYTIKWQIRPDEASTEVDVDYDSSALTAGQSIGTLDATGVISVTLDAAITSALDFGGLSYAYDLLAISDSGAVYRVLKGLATLSPAVTR